MQKIIKKIKKSLSPIKKRLERSNLSNIDYNKNLWDRYAKGWDIDRIPIEDDTLGKKDIRMLGEEWGRRSDVKQVIEEYIKPFIEKESIVAEIGTGGGRIASQIVGETKDFTCFDISAEMLKKAKAALNQMDHVHYELLKKPQFAELFNEKFDFVYSFDVFVHLDLHTIWQYLKGFQKILKNRGRVFIHTANLLAPDGWNRFSSQEEFKVEGHYFISPEIVNILAKKSQFKIIKSSKVDPNNFYYNRDYCVVLEKK